MRRMTLVIAGLCLIGTSPLAQAGWAEFWQRTNIDFHRNNCWPQPFQAQDRELIRSPLIAMTAAGWRQNNTLSDHFFAHGRSGDQSSWRNQSPLDCDPSPSASPYGLCVARCDAGSDRRAGRGCPANDREIRPRRTPPRRWCSTDIVPPGASGDYFDQVDRQFKQSIPAPRLPAMQETTGSGS